MKKLFFIFLLILGLIFPKTSSADGTWKIKNFHSDITIQQNGKIKVVEEITADFGTSEKHGIFRDIPYLYSDKTYTQVAVEQVFQDNLPIKYTITKSSGFVSLKIGNPNQTIKGSHKYQINYTANGVLRSFNDHDELYWNVTGNSWGVDIKNASANIYLEKEGLTRISCFEGVYGSSTVCGNKLKDLRSASFNATRALLPGEGLTIVAGFEKGLFPIVVLTPPKTFFEKLMSFPSLTTAGSVVVGGFLGMIYLWWRGGRDFWLGGIKGAFNRSAKEELKPIGGHEPIIVEYTPPEDLRPAIIGVLMDARADTLDVTSTIIDLANRGFLTIAEEPKKWLFGKVDYTLKKMGKGQNTLLSYEKELMDRLFDAREEIKISELKTTFYKDLVEVKKKLYQEVVARKLFKGSPEKIRTKYLIIGIVILIASIAAVVFFAANELVFLTDLAVGAVTFGILIIIWSPFMPRRTGLGREMYRRVKGYRLFIDRAESYKQQFFERKNIFTEILPYAIVFQLTKKFAKAMSDMGIKPEQPSWYLGTQTFNAATFSSAISNFSNSFSGAIASSPGGSGFSGGGGSGGGFGGGGGGSW